MRRDLDSVARRLKSFREASPSNRPRFPEELRREVAAVASRALSSGWTRSRLAALFGIADPTLVRWLERAEGSWRPVNVVDDALEHAAVTPGDGVRLVSPGGWVIEGLDLDAAVRIIESRG